MRRLPEVAPKHLQANTVPCAGLSIFLRLTGRQKEAAVGTPYFVRTLRTPLMFLLARAKGCKHNYSIVRTDLQ